MGMQSITCIRYHVLYAPLYPQSSILAVPTFAINGTAVEGQVDKVEAHLTVRAEAKVNPTTARTAIRG